MQTDKSSFSLRKKIIILFIPSVYLGGVIILEKLVPSMIYNRGL